MKNTQELLTLTREHHLSLSIANKAINTANSQDKVGIDALCVFIEKTFASSFLPHFNTEETTVFKPLMQMNKVLIKPCEQLIEQHKQLLHLAKNLSDNPQLLAQFGQLLQRHTRFEDRELFPHCAQLSQQQKDSIVSSSLKH